MKPVQIAISPGEVTDTVYVLMADGSLFQGWQEKPKEPNGEPWPWRWEKVSTPKREEGRDVQGR